MKHVINYGLVLLSGILTACTGQKNIPAQINGQPVHEVPFEQPLEINPDKEQVFYFRFKKQPETGQAFTVRAVTIMPSYFSLEGDIPQYQKYKDLADKLVDEKQLQFEMSLFHYGDNGKETKVGLKNNYINYYYDVIYKSPDRKKPVRFESNEKYFIANSVESNNATNIDGENYLMKYITTAGFLMQDKGGYYKLTVRPMKTYPEYPKLKLAVYVNVERTHK